MNDPGLRGRKPAPACDCPLDDCPGNVETPDKKADKDAYWESPFFATEAEWRRDVEESGKGSFVKVTPTP